MTTVAAIVVGAPMHGWVGPLAEVPDPVFAEAMMGDGLAIDPLEGTVRAPCAGRVVAIAATRHSITLELANGAELLIHIGLETVALGGDGFVVHTMVGAMVAAGDQLIAFDLDRVAQRAKSLITPMIIVNDGFSIAVLAASRLADAGDPVFEVRGMPGGAAAVSGVDTASTELLAALANGIHARPAARIVAALKPFAAEVTIAANGRSADARSIVALLGLAIGRDTPVRITARGADARAALAGVVALIESGFGEAVAAVPPAGPIEYTAGGTIRRAVRAAPGIAVGPVAHLRIADVVVPGSGDTPAAEIARFEAARDDLAAALVARLGGTHGDIFAAHHALLGDPGLKAEVERGIAAGANAGNAWRAAIAAAAATLRGADNARISERVADLVDLERQLLARLYGEPPAARLPVGAILVTDELLPSQFLALDAAAIAGIVTAGGGPTAHVAILAASAGVPMLVAAGGATLDLADGQVIVMDADAGTIDTAPAPAALATAAAARVAAAARRSAELADADEACFTADGVRIEVFANLGSLADAAAAVAAGAEGCGLLRTEFLFQDRATAPDEAEQRAAYAAIAAALGGRPIVVRTLDIGGDKPVAYLPAPIEHNPALGLRGIRLGLARPEMLAMQFRAILAAIAPSRCRIMVPMIVDVGELRRVRAIFDAACADIGCAAVPLGVMIETPAAALLGESLAAEADFLSIGSNDLTQYALAADRGNPALAAMIDPLHPAVLRLIAAAAAGAAKHGRWLGVCGGVASDPQAAAILIGLGVTELSATAAAVPAAKTAIRRLRLDDCRALAARALVAGTAADVRALVAAHVDTRAVVGANG